MPEAREDSDAGEEFVAEPNLLPLLDAERRGSREDDARNERRECRVGLERLVQRLETVAEGLDVDGRVKQQLRFRLRPGRGTFADVSDR